ncbi:hypothetical protein CU097_013570, partial [Rhizopus azygosporus]
TQEAVDLKLPASSDELKELLKTNNKVVVLFASYGVLICIAVEAFIYQFVQMILLMNTMVTDFPTVMHFKNHAKAGEVVGCSAPYIYDKATHEDLLN